MLGGAVHDDVMEMMDYSSAPGIHVRQLEYFAVEGGPVWRMNELLKWEGQATVG